jgi:hypothetical protein
MLLIIYIFFGPGAEPFAHVHVLEDMRGQGPRIFAPEKFFKIALHKVENL